MFCNPLKELVKVPGKTGFYYKNLVTGQTISHNGCEELMAASVIKLFVLLDAYEQSAEGKIDMTQFVSVKREDCVPSCGALTYMHDGINVTVKDLCTLMIILSDNTATNVLIDILGMDHVNETIKKYGFSGCSLNRKMFDSKKSEMGIQNYVTADSVGSFFTLLYEGKLVSKKACEEMLQILTNQRLNGKIPFYLHTYPEWIRIAHKTGEDTGITHDAGIIYGREPFVVVFLGNETDVPLYERVMADISKMLYDEVRNI